MDTYKLEKKIWTETDFEQMGWHDCHIYKIRLTNDLQLDIDYILKWNKPDLDGLPFTFWIVPATLVFRQVRNLAFDIDTINEAMEIEDIELTNTNTWTIITRQGDFEFEADGFTQFMRQEPFYQLEQTISFIERGGFSLEQTTEQENTNRHRQDIIEKRKKNFEHYENVKKRQLKRHEKEQLEVAKENNEITLEDYLVKKKEIKKMLDFYDYWLKGTKFESW